MIQLILYIGFVFTVFGFISIVQLTRIYLKYSDMYPWFGGEQPWKTGFYLFFLGISVIILYILLMKNIIGYTLSIIDSMIIILVLSLGVAIPYNIFRPFKKYIVLNA